MQPRVRCENSQREKPAEMPSRPIFSRRPSTPDARAHQPDSLPGCDAGGAIGIALPVPNPGRSRPAHASRSREIAFYLPLNSATAAQKPGFQR
ncbi:hypothetical protein KCP76_02590 [Salmonella enterica subsp. enterica serovar Weltevreden]|nr:hypothetical protein KCP76_02590 [Salmonella enterica subsp. enterica serovar Weltevreden]